MKWNEIEWEIPEYVACIKGKHCAVKYLLQISVYEHTESQ